MLTIEEERRLTKMEVKQSSSFDRYRQRHIDELKDKKNPRVLVPLETEMDIAYARGIPDEPTGVYVEPTKRSAGEYSAFLASQK